MSPRRPPRAFGVAPWTVPETSLDLGRLGYRESVLALANGNIGIRGTLDEGEPVARPGSYLNGVYEYRPLPQAEATFGVPRRGQSVVTVPNGTIVRLLVDDEPLDVRTGRVLAHERVLDLRTGTLRRRLDWASPAGARVRLRSARLVSFVQRSVAAIEYVVDALGPVQLVAQSELVANEPVPETSDEDPRRDARLSAVLRSEDHEVRDGAVEMVHVTRSSGIRISSAMDHEVEGPRDPAPDAECWANLGRTTVVARLARGERLRIVKYLAYGASADRTRAALRDQVAAALAGARATGWVGLVTEQKAYLDAFWDATDVLVTGHAGIQQAVRFALFQLLQGSARTEVGPIGARGLTGPAYDGHAFWDTEAYVLPALWHVLPDAARDALRWRQSTLGAARTAARGMGLPGAAFPWRTLDGEPASGYWPASTAAVHVNADIADAAARYVDATGDARFEAETAVELQVEAARLLYALGHTKAGVFRIDGVTGPDEYSALADDNVFTNLMARRALRAAAASCWRHPAAARRLGVSTEEPHRWLVAAATMAVPVDEHTGVHEQSEGFTRHDVWNFAAGRPEDYPLLLRASYFDLYRKQVVKQADLVLALWLCGNDFTPQEKARDFAYYEPLTVRDSSLSAPAQSVVAAETGHLDLAFDYLRECAAHDLSDLGGTTDEGLHLATLAGCWSALVAGFGGLRLHGNGIPSFSPRLPPGRLEGLSFSVRYRDRLIGVDVRPDRADYWLRAGKALTIRHFGVDHELGPEAPVRVAVPVVPVLAPPGHVPHRPPGLDAPG